MSLLIWFIYCNVLALRHNPAFTEVDELSAHGVFLTFLLLALESLEPGQR